MDIAAWLASLGLAQHAPAFRANDIDSALLRTLTAEDLRELGVTSLGQRKRLLEAIARLDAPADATPTHPSPAAPTEPPSSAERRQLTVMFVDLVGSTALSARLDPEAMSEVLRAYQNAVAGEITRLEGHVAKYMGDGVLAYFGWPRAHEDASERAVRAGLAIVAAVAGLDGGGEPLAARVGIATGLVVVGDLVGEGAAQEQAVVGDTPNTAARLQAIAEPGRVVIAEATRRLLGNVFEVADLGPLALKGLPGPTAAFVVRGERALESRFAARSGAAEAPIVGRDQELALLVERWRQAVAGEGQLVLLTGEAGIGKSRITEALVEAVRIEPHVLLRYQCSPYHADSALWPAVQQLRHAAGIGDADGDDARLDRLEALLGRAAADGAAAAPLIAELIGLDGRARYGAVEGTPQQRRARTLAALLGQLDGLARRRPVLWVIEDAHWIDPTTLELIEAALDRVPAARVLVLVTARPTFVATFGSHPAVTRLALNRLARAATQAIVVRITRGKRLPDALVDEIAARTDGVPLFVEEMTKAVLESGALRETGDAFLLQGPLSGLAIPTSLHDSLMARLDRLHPVKEVAQTAAVIGRSFDHRTIAALSPLPEDELAAAMRRLVEAELVFRRGTPPDATYLFKHALVRDAAYESLLRSKRQALHRRLVAILASTGAGPELLAQHAQAGGEIARAVAWWREAAEAAVGRAAFAEADAHLDAAAALVGGLADQAERRRAAAGVAVARALGSLVQRGYSHPRTVTLYAAAVDLARAAGDPQALLPAVYGVWAGHHVAEEVGPALRVAERLLDDALSAGAADIEMMARRVLGVSQTMAGRLDAARAMLAAAEALYDPARHRSLAVTTGIDPIVGIRAYWALAELALGHPDRAASLVAAARETVRRSGAVNAQGYVLFHAGAVAAAAGRSAEALALGERLGAVSAEHGLSLWAAFAPGITGIALLEGGHAAAAMAEFARWVEATEASGAGLLGAIVRAAMAEAMAVRGDERAIATAAAAELHARRSGALYALAEVQRRQARVLRRLRPDDRAGAEAALLGAIATARDQNARLWELRAALDLARLWAESGQRHAARELLAPILGWFTEGFDAPDLVGARALLDRLG